MTFSVPTFGRDYRRQIFLSSLCSHLPLAAAYKLAGLAESLIGPLRWQEDAFRDAIAAHGLTVGDWDALWRRRLDDHAAFCVNAFLHDAWDHSWVARHVRMDVTGLKNVLTQGKGCLFLTYHHAFHHTLFCLLGLAGFKVDVLASPEESSVIHDWIGPYIHRLHRGCAKQFNGGDYRFFSIPRQAVRMTHDALQGGSVLCSLNDYFEPGNSGGVDTCQLLGRRFSAPSGSIRLARRLGAPIVAGFVLREGLDYQLIVRHLDDRLADHEVMQAYFDLLAEILAERPDFWDGWGWFGGSAETASRQEMAHHD